jgi:hypothetical protein
MIFVKKDPPDSELPPKIEPPLPVNKVSANDAILFHTDTRPSHKPCSFKKLITGANTSANIFFP